MFNIRQSAIGLAVMVMLAGGVKSASADTNDVAKSMNCPYDINDMFQTVVTPTEWSTTQAQHDQLPDIQTMPKLDREALYLFSKEIYTDHQQIVQKMIKFARDHYLELTWGQRILYKYNDGLLEFDFYARQKNEANQKLRIHFFQDKNGKIYQQKTQPCGKRTIIKKWTWVPENHCFGTVEDYKNHIKWSGTLSTIHYNYPQSLEFTESTDDQKRKYYYRADFSSQKTPFGEELKFKTTHISTVDGKSSKPIITETIYKGSISHFEIAHGLVGGVLPPDYKLSPVTPSTMKTFKTIRD